MPEPNSAAPPSTAQRGETGRSTAKPAKATTAVTRISGIPGARNTTGHHSNGWGVQDRLTLAPRPGKPVSGEGPSAWAAPTASAKTVATAASQKAQGPSTGRWAPGSGTGHDG
ncbi:hypothetical protein GCM10025789_29910 [Tessaracoccus lubricantis]|uniref:Uncharacterized protein n=1 Tax=Tessaracoccus lubricantis TaxID=545543 RepID=A0ABP9FNG0_9ACTN